MTQGDGRPDGQPDGHGDSAADLTPPAVPAVVGPITAPGPAGSSILPAVPRQVPPPTIPPTTRTPRPLGAPTPQPQPERATHAAHRAEQAPPGTPRADPSAAPPVIPPAGRTGARPAGGPAPDRPADPRRAEASPTAPSSTAPSGRGEISLCRLRGWQATAIALGLVSVLLVGGAVYLWRTSDAWQERADDYEAANHDLGARLADERAQLEATTSDLTEVREQLATAQTRIIELANEKAQLGDDREAQRMLADYQERVSDAVGRVAKALDQCVQGQDQLIGYMRDAALYDPADLDAYSTSVQELCQQATDANARLQDELSK